MKLGFIGLGKMGSRIVFKLLSDGHEVVVWNRSEEPVRDLESRIKNQESGENLKVSTSIEDLVGQLDSPKIIWSMLPAGEATETILDEVTSVILNEREGSNKDSSPKASNDESIIIDGGNAFYKDTEHRYQEFKKNNIRFLGIGVSGGILAEKNGYPLMAGGDKSAYDYIRSILDSLAKPSGGHDYLGTGGAGHFVKMVHNAIEYSYMQGIGEGFGVMEKAPYDLDLKKVAEIYTKNTLISGFMMDRAVEALAEDEKLLHIAGVIGSASLETVWTVNQAKAEEVPIENIEQALEFRKRSEIEPKVQNSFAAKLIAALRIQFGGHEVKKK